MQTLNEALGRMQTTLAEQGWKSPTPQLGSTNTAGQLTIHPSNQQVEAHSINPKNKLGLAQQSKSLPKIAQGTQQEVEQFTFCLSQSCVMLKQYGKTPAELKSLRDGFLYFLREFLVIEIMQALEVHVTNNDEIPTPKQLKDAIIARRESVMTRAEYLARLQRKNERQLGTA